MEWIYGVILVLYICFGFFCKRKNKEKMISEHKAYEKGFHKGIAVFIVEKVLTHNIHNKSMGEKTNVRQAFLNLNNVGGEKKWQEFSLKKISMVLKLFFFGTIAAFCVSIFLLLQSNLGLEKIERNEIGEGDMQMELEASQGEMKGEITLTVGEKRYSEEEIEALYETLTVQLNTLIFQVGDGSSAVRHSLNLPTRVENYPFEITWESSDYEVVDSDGSVFFEEVDENGAEIILTAVITYYDFSFYYQFPIMVYPEQLSIKEAFQRDVSLALKTAESETKEESEIALPAVINGEEVSFFKKQEDTGLQIWMFAIAISVLFYWYMDKKVIQSSKLREEELAKEYSLVVSKLTLYIGAGLSLRHAFHKTAFAGEKEGFVYQEMQRICHEMESGIPEKAAYDKFGKYCNEAEYVKLSLLLSQNLLKGSNRLSSQLKEETKEAFEKRRNQARKLGKEAGTKLLGPMMIMLIIVMLFIMVPAFFSFS